MITQAMFEMLACPSCSAEELALHKESFDLKKGSIETGKLECASCGSSFEIAHGVPNLVPAGSLVGEVWDVWKDHLHGFDARQQEYIDHLSERQAERWREKLRAFSSFMDPHPGPLLDIGCGTGSLRHALDTESIAYVGIDPLPTPNASEFHYARAVAEALPFRAGTFSSVVIRSALDHLCELDRFFSEVKRVLTPEGHLYVEQAIHDWERAKDVPRFLVHKVKDIVDDWRNPQRKTDAPKHMNEFTRKDLNETLNRAFEILGVEEYSRNWYTPTQLFVELRG